MTPSFCSDLFRDYLSDAASITAGVPDNTALRKQSISDLRKAKAPRLLVAVQADPEKKHPSKLIYDVHVVIEAELAITPRATVEQWANIIRARIEWGNIVPASADADRFDSLSAWIQANRTTEQRTGWQIEKLRVFPSEDSYNNDGETQCYSIIVPMKLTLRVPS